MNMEVETTGLERQTQTAENSKIKYVIYYVLPGYTLGGEVLKYPKVPS